MEKIILAFILLALAIGCGNVLRTPYASWKETVMRNAPINPRGFMDNLGMFILYGRASKANFYWVKLFFLCLLGLSLYGLSVIIRQIIHGFTH